MNDSNVDYELMAKLNKLYTKLYEYLLELNVITGNLILAGEVDKSKIEHYLDQYLSLGDIHGADIFFNKLYNYYMQIDEEAATWYMNRFHELYDYEKENEMCR